MVDDLLDLMRIPEDDATRPVPRDAASAHGSPALGPCAQCGRKARAACHGCGAAACVSHLAVMYGLCTRCMPDEGATDGNEGGRGPGTGPGEGPPRDDLDLPWIS